MIKIFYDLETSSQHFVGQILNYTFIAVDSEYQIISSLSNEIKIKRLELPEVGAILANRINVLEHQENTTETEWEASKAIREYIDGICYEFKNQKIQLIGYNSARFDLPFLRTVMIRNGVSPYFSKNLENLDLFHVVQYLSVTNKNFPRLNHPDKDESRLSLKLETLTKAFGLLKGKQTHNSFDDVKLTIDFAEYLENEFDVNLSTFDAYKREASLKPGAVVNILKPNYDLNAKSLYDSDLGVLLFEDYRSSLWLNISKVKQESKNPISYVNRKTGIIITSSKNISKEEEKEALKYYKKYKGITISDFFKKSTCDIELDIYRLDFDQIDYLHSKIWEENYDSNLSKPSRDAKILLTRYKLNQIDDNSFKDSAVFKKFKSYVDYRYGGKLQLWKAIDDNLAKEDKERAYFPKLKSLLTDIKVAKKEKTKKEDQKLILALEKYYLSSPIYEVIENE